jgi:mycothiol synthase
MSAAFSRPYLLRPAAPTDLEAVAALMAVCNAADYDEPVVAIERVRQIWQTPAFDLARDAWLAADPSGGLMGYAHRAPAHPGSLDAAFYVDPSQRTGELETLLLAQIGMSVRASLAAHGPVELVARVSDNNSPGWHALERAGYRQMMTFAAMQRVLDTPPAEPRWPAGLVMRQFVPGQDDFATYLADEEASLDKGYHTSLTFEQWAVRMDLAGERCDPALWFLAWDGPEVAGVALSYHDAANDIGWIDHLGVRRPWRGRGLGQALLWQAFAAFHQRGVGRVRLNVDVENRTQAQRVYERAGMRTIREYHIYVKRLESAL